jgi:hypothetical protein
MLKTMGSIAIAYFALASEHKSIAILDSTMLIMVNRNLTRLGCIEVKIQASERLLSGMIHQTSHLVTYSLVKSYSFSMAMAGLILADMRWVIYPTRMILSMLTI